MTEQDLIKLEFERVDVSAEESGDKAFFYYFYHFGKGFSLISYSSDQLVDGKWFVEVFEEENIRFTNSTDVMALIDLIKRNTIK